PGAARSGNGALTGSCGSGCCTTTGVNVSRLRSVADSRCAADVATTYSVPGSNEPAGTVTVVVNDPSTICGAVTHACASHPLDTSGPLPSHSDFSPTSTYAPLAADRGRVVHDDGD